MRVDEFDFHLPEERIALRPEAERQNARLLVVKGDGDLVDRQIADLPYFLKKDDVVVINDTRVIPAQLSGTRERLNELTGEMVSAQFGVTLHQRIAADAWLAFLRPAKKVREGETIRFGDGLSAVAKSRDGEGGAKLLFSQKGAELDTSIAQVGRIPLPPYIASKRDVDEQDLQDYQTSYAAHDGAVAAPTAGLHLTTELMKLIENAGAKFARVTLHVGAGTFLPVKADDTSDHVMHSEVGEVSAQTADMLNKARQAGGRIIAIGTTSLRLLETCADEHGVFHSYADATDIFITPGYKFGWVVVLMTNFHPPKSTLLMLVSAFSGLTNMRNAYSHAIESAYRFYSYGDACLLFPEKGSK
jgi:S-adenosylmethionine:tRNA ribosyltransferase-isomerase